MGINITDNIYIYIAIYLVIISIVAIVLTLKDKRAAKRNSWRVEEKLLFLVSAIGGSLAMLLTMKAVRHKTHHKRFMVGIPVIIILQIAAIGAIVWWRLKV